MGKSFGLLGYAPSPQGPGIFDRVVELRAGRHFLFVKVRAITARPICEGPLSPVSFARNFGDTFAVTLFNRWYLSVAVELGRYSDGCLREMGVLPPERFDDVVEALS